MNVIEGLPPKLALEKSISTGLDDARHIIAVDKRNRLYHYDPRKDEGWSRFLPIINRERLESADLVFLAEAYISNDGLVSNFKCWALYRIESKMVFDFSRKCYHQTYPHNVKQQRRPGKNKWKNGFLTLDDFAVGFAADEFRSQYLLNQTYQLLGVPTEYLGIFKKAVFPIPFPSIFERLGLQWQYTEEQQEEALKKWRERQDKRDLNYVTFPVTKNLTYKTRILFDDYRPEHRRQPR